MDTVHIYMCVCSFYAFSNNIENEQLNLLAVILFKMGWRAPLKLYI